MRLGLGMGLGRQSAMQNWSPQKLSGLWGWWVAEDILANGNFFHWYDRQAARDFSSVGGDQPSRIIDVDGTPSILFEGGQDVLALIPNTDPWPQGSRTVVMLFCYDSTLIYRPPIILREFACFYIRPDNRIGIGRNGATDEASWDIALATGSSDPNSLLGDIFHVQQAWINTDASPSTETWLYLDTNEAASLLTGSSGGGGGTILGGAFIGRIKEVLILDGAISEQQRNQLQGYFRKKYPGLVDI